MSKERSSESVCEKCSVSGVQAGERVRVVRANERLETGSLGWSPAEVFLDFKVPE